jgi:hypothetical protein
MNYVDEIIRTFLAKLASRMLNFFEIKDSEKFQEGIKKIKFRLFSETTKK